MQKWVLECSKTYLFLFNTILNCHWHRKVANAWLMSMHKVTCVPLNPTWNKVHVMSNFVSIDTVTCTRIAMQQGMVCKWSAANVLLASHCLHILNFAFTNTAFSESHLLEHICLNTFPTPTVITRFIHVNGLICMQLLFVPVSTKTQSALQY